MANKKGNQKTNKKPGQGMNKKAISISPNSLNLYYECPLCFWLDKRKGIKRPFSFPFALNVAIDEVLKQDFDKYRKKKEFHPLLVAHNIPAKLFPKQKLLDEWRDRARGIRYYDANLDAELFGAIDDVLEFSDQKFAVMSYKSTDASVENIYDRFQLQMDIYTFLLEKNGYETIKKACLAFYIIDKKADFKDKLPFKKEIHIINTDPSYAQEVFKEAVLFLKKEAPLSHSEDCKYGEWLVQISNLKKNQK